ncbi:hypothetical protein [Kocuria palustris]|uniref:hypothetical protein n=2 Tax=Bacteria TaxID=2 RepID=UPI0011A86D8C|nr:hypothetical protein [Kocuria palustris]
MSPNRSRGSTGGSADRPDDASSGPLSCPSRLLQAGPDQLRPLTAQPEASRESLRAVAADSSAAVEDRIAAAVLLDAVLDDPRAAETVAAEDAETPEALRLRFSPQLRPSAARILGTPATMRLLTWAAESTPGAPPVEAAEAAAHLGVDDDGRIYGRVSQRAVQIAEHGGLGRAAKDRLRTFTDALGAADQQARRQRAERAASRPDVAAASEQDPASEAPASDPRTRAAPEAPARRGPEEPGPDPHDADDDAAPASWTSADDAALASMLGHGADAPKDERGLEDRDRDGQGPGTASARDKGDDGRGPSSPAVGGAIAASGSGPGRDAPADPMAGQQPPEAPAFGRPVGFDGGADGTAGSGASAAGGPGGPLEEGVDDRPGTGPGYGPTGGTTGTEPPRSYDFRYLGDDTRSPSSEAEKAEFRTTLRNWGLFALALVFVLIIVGIII